MDLRKIRPGDVLLTRNIYARGAYDRTQSATICKTTGGNFSHAMLCTQTPTFIEAVGDGVSNISIQNCFVYDLKNVRVIRHMQPEISQSAALSALMFLGRPYSVKRAIASVLPQFGNLDTDDHGIFCSALVAAAYIAAKCPRFADLNPMKVTPRTLEEMGGFNDVTENVFFSILTPPNLEKMSALDGDRAWSPLGEQAKILRDYFYTAFTQCQSITNDFPRFITSVPESFFELVEFVAQGLGQKLLLDPSTLNDPQLVELMRRLEALDQAVYKALSDNRYESMLDEAIRVDADSSRRLIEESFKPDPDFDVEDLAAISEASDKQIEDRSRLLTAYASYPAGMCLTLDKWLDLTRKGLKNFESRKVMLSEILERVSSARMQVKLMGNGAIMSSI